MPLQGFMTPSSRSLRRHSSFLSLQNKIATTPGLSSIVVSPGCPSADPREKGGILVVSKKSNRHRSKKVKHKSKKRGKHRSFKKSNIDSDKIEENKKSPSKIFASVSFQPHPPSGKYPSILKARDRRCTSRRNGDDLRMTGGGGTGTATGSEGAAGAGAGAHAGTAAGAVLLDVGGEGAANGTGTTGQEAIGVSRGRVIYCVSASWDILGRGGHVAVRVSGFDRPHCYIDTRIGDAMNPMPHCWSRVLRRKSRAKRYVAPSFPCAWPSPPHVCCQLCLDRVFSCAADGVLGVPWLPFVTRKICELLSVGNL